jgi:hypothetical protein
LHASALIAIWQRLVSFNISCDFDVLGTVMWKAGRFTVDIPSAGDRRVADICLALKKSKPRPTNKFEILVPSAKIVNGRSPITAFRGF